VAAVAVASDGRTALSGSEDKTLKLWDLSTGNEKRTFQDTDRVLSVVFMPNGDPLSGSQDKTLKQWSFSTGTPYWIFQGHTGPVRSVVITPDGLAALSGSEDKTIKRWDSCRRRDIGTIGYKGETGAVFSVAVTRDGRAALSGSEDKTLTLWQGPFGP